MKNLKKKLPVHLWGKKNLITGSHERVLLLLNIDEPIFSVMQERVRVNDSGAEFSYKVIDGPNKESELDCLYRVVEDYIDYVTFKEILNKRKDVFGVYMTCEFSEGGDGLLYVGVKVSLRSGPNDDIELYDKSRLSFDEFLSLAEGVSIDMVCELTRP